MSDTVQSPGLAHQAPLSMELSRQEYWSGLSIPTPGDLLHPGIEPRSLALQADSLPLNHQGSPIRYSMMERNTRKLRKTSVETEKEDQRNNRFGHHI